MGTGTEYAQKNHRKRDSFWEGDERLNPRVMLGTYLGPRSIFGRKGIETDLTMRYLIYGLLENVPMKNIFGEC